MNQKKILALLFVGVLMGALDISIVGPAIPSIEKTIDVAAKDIGWIFSIYVLFNLVGISLFAKLSDLYGRRSIYMLSLALFAIGSLVVALADDFQILLIGRSIQGFGSSGIFPVASAVIGDIFPPGKTRQVPRINRGGVGHCLHHWSGDRWNVVEFFSMACFISCQHSDCLGIDLFQFSITPLQKHQ